MAKHKFETARGRTAKQGFVRLDSHTIGTVHADQDLIALGIQQVHETIIHAIIIQMGSNRAAA